ncbi:MAG: hypothetical protein COV36_06370 [Alphaproteobacteria bacterium CG11_big_fil_rev_8_21_14_0_20_44_7]|nr:MAG: hypothetical protein COV36_06370 [Alphaproteobacteria bacterium CG11_big_fil_rev_8_21_14_0_20_44_7]
MDDDKPVPMFSLPPFDPKNAYLAGRIPLHTLQFRLFPEEAKNISQKEAEDFIRNYGVPVDGIFSLFRMHLKLCIEIGHFDPEDIYAYTAWFVGKYYEEAAALTPKPTDEPSAESEADFSGTRERADVIGAIIEAVNEHAQSPERWNY